MTEFINGTYMQLRASCPKYSIVHVFLMCENELHLYIRRDTMICLIYEMLQSWKKIVQQSASTRVTLFRCRMELMHCRFSWYSSCIAQNKSAIRSIKDQICNPYVCIRYTKKIIISLLTPILHILLFSGRKSRHKLEI